MSNIKYFIAVLACIFQLNLQSAEIDKGLVVIDNKPWKNSWIQENNDTWILLANFDKGELRTYFKKTPPKKGLGLPSENKPVKQQFEFYLGEKFISSECQFEQWPDGAKAYAFKYDNTFKRDDRKYLIGTTAIIEEVNGEDDEIRNAIYPGF